MEDERFEAIFWREANHRCELWAIDSRYELRVYLSNVLTHREPVRASTLGLHQAAKLLSRAQAAIRAASNREERDALVERVQQRHERLHPAAPVDDAAPRADIRHDVQPSSDDQSQ